MMNDAEFNQYCDDLTEGVSVVATRCAIALERGMPVNRVMSHMIKEGNSPEIKKQAKMILDVVLKIREEFNPTKPYQE